MMKGLERRTYEERLKGWEEQASGGGVGLINVFKYLKGRCKEEGVSSFQCCPLKGPEAMGTKGNSESSN